LVLNYNEALRALGAVFRILTALVGSGHLGPDPDASFIYFLEPISGGKIPEETCQKIYLGQDPDPVKNRPDPQHMLGGSRLRSSISYEIDGDCI
jgi:hypothetical protein